MKEKKEAEAAKAKEIEAKKDKLKPKEQTPEQKKVLKEFEAAAEQFDSFEKFVESQASNELIDRLVNTKALKGDDLYKAAEQTFNKNRTEYRDKAYKFDDRYKKTMSIADAEDTISKYVDSNTISEWYNNSSGAAMARIEREALKNPEMRNAGLNIAHQQYNDNVGKNLTYNEFLDADITVYRGGDVDFRSDRALAYSYKKEAAEHFMGEQALGDKGGFDTVTVKGREMLGLFNGERNEGEVFIRRGRKKYE